MRRLTAALALAGSLIASSALAQNYPSRPIVVVLPYAAGGPTDTVARIVSEAMGAELGGRMVIENVIGASGSVGSGRVASAEPDGHTLLFNHIGHATAVSFYRNLSYHPVTSFEPIGQVGDVPMTIIARRTFPTDDLQSFVDYVKANGAKLTYAHAGLGTASYLCGLLLLKAINANATAVPYKGTGPAMVDLLGGQVDFMCDQTTNTTGPINDKLVKVFALTAPRRLGTLPEVPTTAEAGLKDFELSIWHGYYAPKGTPKPVLDRLNAALRKALQSKPVMERFAQLGMTRAAEEDVTPDSLRKKLESEIARWEPVIRAAPQQGQ